MREIYIKSKAGLLPIGRRGENLATRVHLAEVPAEGQAVTVFVKRNGDSASYPASQVEITDTEIIWTVTSVDTGKSGRGKVQYRFADSVTGEIIKTEIYGFLVGLAIDTEVGPAPDPYETWLDSLTDLAGQVQLAARDAEADATRAAESAEQAEESATAASASATTATTKASEASASATAAQEARTGAETAQAGAESAAQTAQAGADAVGLLREQIYNSYPNVEAEAGPIVSIPDGADGIPVKSLVVGIEPVQSGSGDPSPDNVRPITGWTGANVQRTGKNLLPFVDLFEEGWTNTLNGITATYSNGHMKVTGTNTSSGWTNIVSYRVAWEGNPYHFGAGTYIMSDKISITVSIDGRSYVNKTTGFTAQESVLVKGFYISVGTNRTADWDIPLMFVYGSTRPTTYEPYSGSTYPITFPSSAGAVCGGSLDVTSGVLTVDRAIIASYAGETLPGAWISDRDVYAEGVTPTTGAQVVYELAEPQTYQLTPTEVTTLLGANSVWADTGDVQEMAYRADTKLYIDGVYEDYQDALADYADALAALG